MIPMRYMIVSAMTCEALASKVTAMLSQGWGLYGNPMCVVPPSMMSAGTIMFYQALTFIELPKTNVIPLLPVEQQIPVNYTYHSDLPENNT